MLPASLHRTRRSSRGAMPGESAFRITTVAVPARRYHLAMCPLCEHSREPGWLCAEHGKAWEHDGCGAEGMPCRCNPQGEVEWREVFAQASGSKLRDFGHGSL